MGAPWPVSGSNPCYPSSFTPGALNPRPNTVRPGTIQAALEKGDEDAVKTRIGQNAPGLSQESQG